MREGAGTVFSPRGAVAIFVFGGTLLVLCIAAAFGGSDEPSDEPGPTTFSSSAVGYRALVAFLRARGTPVIVARREYEHHAGEHGLVIFAEPRFTMSARESFAGLTRMGPGLEVMVVLPKWDTTADPSDPAMAKSADWKGEEPTSTIFNNLSLGGAAVKKQFKAIDDADLYSTRTVSGHPFIEDPQLLVNASADDVVLGGSHGLLLGRIAKSGGGGPFWVLSDPDLIANHGLWRGDNAAIIGQFIDEHRHGGPVVIDEMIHGLARPQGVMHLLVTPPLAFASLHALACALLFVAAGITRMGRPLPLEPAIPPGLATLINNMSGLLGRGRHGPELLDDAWRTARIEVLRTLRLQVAAKDATPALRRASVARGTVDEFDAIEAIVAVAGSGQDIVHTAARIARWKREMIHGVRG